MRILMETVEYWQNKHHSALISFSKKLCDEWQRKREFNV